MNEGAEQETQKDRTGRLTPPTNRQWVIACVFVVLLWVANWGGQWLLNRGK